MKIVDLSMRSQHTKNAHNNFILRCVSIFRVLVIVQQPDKNVIDVDAAAAAFMAYDTEVIRNGMDHKISGKLNAFCEYMCMQRVMQKLFRQFGCKKANKQTNNFTFLILFTAIDLNACVWVYATHRMHFITKKCNKIIKMHDVSSYTKSEEERIRKNGRGEHAMK